MTSRLMLFAALLCAPATVLAQQTAPRPAPAPVQQPRPAQPSADSPRAVEPRPAEARPVERAVPVESPGQIAARRAGQPVNVRVDVSFLDQTGTEKRTKTVTVVTADGLTGFVRTIAIYDGPSGGAVPLNIDVEPRILTGGKIRLLLNLQYSLPALNAAEQPRATVLRSTEIRENLSVVLDDGKPMMVAQSADPVGDRRVTVEVVASITK